MGFICQIVYTYSTSKEMIWEVVLSRWELLEFLRCSLWLLKDLLKAL